MSGAARQTLKKSVVRVRLKEKVGKHLSDKEELHEAELTRYTGTEHVRRYVSELQVRQGNASASGSTNLKEREEMQPRIDLTPI